MFYQEKFLVLDYETRSEVDLKKAGAEEYARDPSTKMLCVSWALGTLEELKTIEPKVWSPAIPSDYGEFKRSLLDKSITLVAHNVGFEQAITKYVLSKLIHNEYLKEIPVTRWLCTASLAAACALPRSLEELCKALSLSHQKDSEGHRLMLKYCKPRRETKNDKSKWHSNLSELKRLMEYCRKDVKAECEVLLTLPRLTETERKIWELDQKINQYGFAVDSELVDLVLNSIATEQTNLDREFKLLTHGKIKSTNQREKLLSFVNSYGANLKDLRAPTILEKLKSETINPIAKRALEIRRDLSKTSTAKYEAFKLMSKANGVIRGTLMYHAAGPGRWGGKGVQPHNFPRPTMKNIDSIIEDIKKENLETIRMLYGNPLDVFSNCIRGVIVPRKGKEFFCSDYASIETRVLFWLAKHEDGLKALAAGEDIYKQMSSKIYGIPVEDVTKDERQLGKAAILGCGYGMGALKFLVTCNAQGLSITEEHAKLAVYTYRKEHSKIPRLWEKYELAAVHAVKFPKEKVKVNGVKFFIRGKFLCIELPSGRKLSYFKPRIAVVKTPWGEKKKALCYYSTNPTTKKWNMTSTHGGKITENIVQAVARDFMAYSMLEIDKAGYEIVLTVHDEILVEREIGKGKLSDFEALMSLVPEWGTGCPIKVEGWQGNRYRK